MSEDSAPLTVTLKGGGGYDAPWLVIRGDNPQQVAEMLKNLGELPEVVAQQASLFAGVVSAGPITAPPANDPPAPAWGSVSQQGFTPANPGQQWSQPVATNGPPPQQQGAALHPENKQCSMCGQVLQYKVVTRRSDQKQFKFWACPNQKSKDDGHTSEFA